MNEWKYYYCDLCRIYYAVKDSKYFRCPDCGDPSDTRETTKEEATE